MQISITVPTKAQIINGGFSIAISAHGTEWLKGQLGDYADRSGVYIIHSNGKILYIGKTTQGDYGTFGERLRRHCQEKASRNSQLFQSLLAQKTPVRAYLLDLSDLDMMIDQGPMTLSPVRKALIMEQALIGIYEPPENRADAASG
ncbi:MAG: GIY-YIG nuclease family protein [Gammaproteobacteria bacterium]|nr:GIY-YIG nuclease family protein [Gammaproteobacteria bacterium]